MWPFRRPRREPSEGEQAADRILACVQHIREEVAEVRVILADMKRDPGA